jgi:hypothetical protein
MTIRLLALISLDVFLIFAVLALALLDSGLYFPSFPQSILYNETHFDNSEKVLLFTTVGMFDTLAYTGRGRQ